MAQASCSDDQRLNDEEAELEKRLAQVRRAKCEREARRLIDTHRAKATELSERRRVVAEKEAELQSAQEACRAAQTAANSARASASRCADEVDAARRALDDSPLVFSLVDPQDGRLRHVVGERRFRDEVHELFEAALRRQEWEPTTCGTSSFNRRWTACSRSAARASAARDAIKLLESNGLSVPSSYVGYTQPTEDCYSG